MAPPRNSRQPRRAGLAVVGLGFVVLTFTGAAAGKARPQAASLPPQLMAELWEEPADLEARDLYWGPGGQALAPKSDAEFRYRESDTTGHSAGYRVVDGQGRHWKVKVGDEAQTETVVSRVFWAIGYHQPVTYFVPSWRMSGGPTVPAAPGCFRLTSDHDSGGEWDWRRNPFANTQALRGLLVANLVLNNWDLAASNNRIYRLKKAHGGARWYVVQDVGGALGKSSWPIGSRNKIDDFEAQGLIKGVGNGHVKVDFESAHASLFDDLTPADVVWACRLISRLSDRQLTDAFRAAEYPADVRDRYVRKIRQKLAQGLALAAAPGSAR